LLETLEIDFDNAATPNLVLEQNFQNTGTWRFGAEWVPAPRWTVRGGYLRHPPATPPETVTPILPEGGRNSAMAGLGVRLGERWTLDLAYMYLRQDHRRGRVRNPTPGTPTETVVDQFNRGVFRFNAHLVSATVSARFP
jgi:long-chain fatty acid transport protein